MVAAVFFESGRRHASDPVGRAASIGLSPGVTRMLGWGEMAAALGVALGVFTQVAALGLMVISLGAIQKKLFEWHIGFWGENRMGGTTIGFLVSNCDPDDRRRRLVISIRRINDTNVQCCALCSHIRRY